jgi:threonylcarbamoyladenosine tRNA methylthiotransferase MtaB
VRRAAIANLGCKVNQAEMEGIERLLRAAGVELVDGSARPDLVVVNTCTVTSIADRKSRQLVRRARRESPEAALFVTGCSVAVDPESLARAAVGARLFDNESKGRLQEEIARLLEPSDGAPMPTLSGVEPGAMLRPARPTAPFVAEASSDVPYSEGSIDRTRAFVKIQDGCSFHCTYCIIPRARGPERSVPAAAVFGEIRRALSAGHREVVLTGINAGTYCSEGLALAGLIGRILAETAVERIRLSSIEPQHLSDELLAVWAGSGGRCLPHFHVPLQSGDDTVLRRMGRRYDTAEYAGVVERIRRVVPAAAVHADLIVGFPGEDEAAWTRTAAFVQGLSLAGVHVFRYSSRPGTAAVRMVGQVDARTTKRRAAQALALARESRAAYARDQLGRELRVLFEHPLSGGRWVGYAENYVPVAVRGSDRLKNAIQVVAAESIDPGAPERVIGRLVGAEPDPG